MEGGRGMDTCLESVHRTGETVATLCTADGGTPTPPTVKSPRMRIFFRTPLHQSLPMALRIVQDSEPFTANLADTPRNPKPSTLDTTLYRVTLNP